MLILNYFTSYYLIIISGLRIRNTIGYKWAVSRRKSFDFITCSGLVNDLNCPCCVVEYIRSEYAAVKNLIIEINSREIVE